VDLTLNEEQTAFRKAVREWVDDVVTPRALQNDREERFPQEALEGLRKNGFLGLTVPEQYGGGGADPLSYILMIEELGRGDANVRSIVSVHLGLVAGVLERMGTDEQKSRWLPQLATGEVLACFGLTEPDYGSDAGNLQGVAEKQADGTYRLNTRKIFITNGTIAGLALVMARTGGAGSRGVSAFLVPTDTPGFTANPIHGKLGLRSCDTASWCSTTSSSALRRCSAASRARASRPRCRRSATAACRSPPRAPGSSRPAWTP
jgi:alkylation response protein AidB-like acyl-CoA dehydrogenase